MIKNQIPILISDLGMLFPKSTSLRKARYGLYRCFCGKEFKTQTQSVKNGVTTSCGCYQKKQASMSSVLLHTTHGFTQHPLYNIWSHMIDRCNNPKNKAYKNYGGRGITVCQRWLNVENFVQDMYPFYKQGLTLDRENNDLGYSNDNCRWATSFIQRRNTRILKATNTSGYRGVSFIKRLNKFQVNIMVDNTPIYLGLAETAIDGASIYNQYVLDNNLEHTKNIL